MVKTRSDLKGIRVGTKAPRKLPPSHNSGSSGNSGRSSKKYDGGNTYCPRETPSWQKEITNFFPSNSYNDIDVCTSNCSTSNSDSASGSSISNS